MLVSVWAEQLTHTDEETAPVCDESLSCQWYDFDDMCGIILFVNDGFRFGWIHLNTWSQW